MSSIRKKRFLKCVKNPVAVAVSLALTGCSVTTLRCATDDESSFVELINIPQDIGGQSRYFRDLCSFAYEGDE